MEKFPKKNTNPVLRVDMNGTVLYSNEAGEPLLHEWSVKTGEKLPSSIIDLVRRVISQNSPEKLEIKVGKRLYLVVFHPLNGKKRVTISGFDISDHKELEEKSRESIKKYHKLLNLIGEGILICELVFDEKGHPVDHIILDVNPAFEKHSGLRHDQIIGRRIKEILPIVEQTWLNRYAEVVRTGMVVHFEEYNASLDKWLDVIASSMGDNRVIALFRDISERKLLETTLKRTYDNLEEVAKKRTLELIIAYKSLKEIERGLAEAQAIAHIGNWEWDIATDKVYWSEEMYRIFKRNPQESAPTFTEYLNYIHPDDLDNYYNAIKNAVKESTFGFDYRIILASKEERTVHLKSEFIFNDENIPIRVKGIVQDITERKKAEEKVQIFANIVESSNDAIGTLSLDGIITSWNKGGEHIYGYSKEEIIGENISILAPPHLSEETKMLSEQVKQGKGIHNHETKRLRKDGKIVDVSITFSPVFDIHGQLAATSFITRDISERKIAEKILFEEKQMAEIANRAKSEFLANISHELRTPLNSIIGFSEMLNEQAYGELNKKQLRSVQNILNSGKHLLNLINGILDISKVESGKLKLEYEDFEIVSKLNLIQNLMSPIADKKNIKIEIDVDSNLKSIFADEDRFAQVMYNLVDNAIKFSHENSVVKIVGRKKGDMVEITVNDTGIGIKAEDQKKLFKPFSQVDYFSSKQYQGTGLGLSLVKQIVHLHGGYVWFKSYPEEGSTFAFTIPINNNAEKGEYVEQSEYLKPYKVYRFI
jgi:PAS domain S-box-containing protein